jgi:hypothetical protein
MNDMNAAERFELACAPLAAAAGWLAWPALPHRVALGHAVLAASALLLLQSLVRDLWLLRASARSATPRESSAMCVESVLGMAGVVAGAVASFVAATMIDVSRPALALAAFGVVVAGFLLKDWVIERAPWRLRREPDHVNLVVRWRA